MRSSVLFAAATLAQAGAFAPPSVERLSTALDFFGGAKNKAAKSSPLAGALISFLNETTAETHILHQRKRSVSTMLSSIEVKAKRRSENESRAGVALSSLKSLSFSTRPKDSSTR